MATKKTDIAARFGARYGLKIRRLIVSIEKQSRAKHVCPNCFKKALKRQAAGIWVCKRCGYKMAGGAYSPFTDAQKIIQKMVK
ncbi:MAG: 50S ribosomal protein L37ae [Candidatus Nanohaloarchaeota archaeon]|nr:50S ribosomal protein L37ae [Candidatus Nanohaloarchaeota archaeon]